MSDETSNIVHLPTQDTAVAFLDKAMASGSIEIIERAMALYERREARAALVAYNRALAIAKAQIPKIVKDQIAQYDHRDGRGRTSYTYAALASICAAVDPALSQHGLYYRWRTETEPNQPIRVTCIVWHEQGHSEENTLAGVADTSGSKNPIQAVISTVTYLKRDTLCSALGIAAGRDDDAKAAAGKPAAAEPIPISPEEVASVQRRIVALGIDPKVFYDVMSKHARREITKIEDLTNVDMKACWREFDEFEHHQKRQKKAPQQ